MTDGGRTTLPGEGGPLPRKDGSAGLDVGYRGEAGSLPRKDVSTDALTLTKETQLEESGFRPRKKRKDAGMARGARGPRTSDDKAKARTPEQVKADKAMLATALAGAFQGLGVILGPHWALQTNEPPQEPAGGPIDQAALLAEVWDPVLERYSLGDMEKFKDALMWVGAVTVTVALTKPRIELTVSQGKGLVGWLKRKLAARKAKAKA